MAKDFPFSVWKFQPHEITPIMREGTGAAVYHALLRGTQLADRGLWLATEVKEQYAELEKHILHDLPQCASQDLQRYLEQHHCSLHDALLALEREHLFTLGSLVKSSDRILDGFFSEGIINYPDNPEIKGKHIIVVPIEFCDYLDESTMNFHGRNIGNFYDRVELHGVLRFEVGNIRDSQAYSLSNMQLPA